MIFLVGKIEQNQNGLLKESEMRVSIPVKSTATYNVTFSIYIFNCFSNTYAEDCDSCRYYDNIEDAMERLLKLEENYRGTNSAPVIITNYPNSMFNIVSNRKKYFGRCGVPCGVGGGKI